MTLTLVDFWPFEWDDSTIGLHKNADKAPGNLNSAMVINPSDPPSGCEGGQFSMLMGPGIKQATNWDSDSFDGASGTTWITTLWVHFNDTAIATHADPDIEFIYCMDAVGNVEWELVLKGEFGPWGDHRLYFHDKNGVQSIIDAGPFTDLTYAKIDIRWTHANNSTVEFKVNNADPDTPTITGQNLLTLGTAGDVHFILEGQVDGSGTPPQTAPTYWMVAHHESTTSADLPTPNFSKLVIDPAGRAGLIADATETGATPGDTGINSAENIYLDDASTQGLSSGLFVVKGLGYACAYSPARGGPSGRLGANKTIYGYKFVLFYDGSLNSADPGLIYGRANSDLTSWQVTSKNDAQIRTQKRVNQIVLPGSSFFPVIDNGEFAVIGMKHNGASVSTISMERVWVVGIYDPDSGQSRVQVNAFGDINFLGTSDIMRS